MLNAHLAPLGHALITNKHNALAQLAMQQIQNKTKIQIQVFHILTQRVTPSQPTNTIGRLCRNTHTGIYTFLCKLWRQQSESALAMSSGTFCSSNCAQTKGTFNKQGNVPAMKITYHQKMLSSHFSYYAICMKKQSARVQSECLNIGQCQVALVANLPRLDLCQYVLDGPRRIGSCGNVQFSQVSSFHSLSLCGPLPFCGCM